MIKEFEFINFFRAFTAFWVLCSHCMIWGGWYGIPLPSAKVAVDLFMIVSGFLMAANAAARNNIEPLNTLRNRFRFYLRRFFRLAPAYYISLVLAVTTGSYFLAGYSALQNLNRAAWPAGGIYDPALIHYTFKNIMLHLSFLFGLFSSYSFSTFLPDWSLSLEMQFYFFFPCLFLAMKYFGFIRTALSIGITSVFVGEFILKNYWHSEPSLIIIKLQYFLAGILLYYTLISKNTVKVRIGAAISALFLVSLDYKYGKQIVVMPILFLLMLIFGWLESKNKMPVWTKNIIRSRLVRFSSDTSYGLYLFHGFFISASGLILSSQPTFLALPASLRVVMMILFVSTGAYLTAYIVFRFVELPGIRLGRRITEQILPLKTKQAVIIAERVPATCPAS